MNNACKKKKRKVFAVHRYGLPVNFQAMLLQPNKKNMKKLREVLYDLYKHLDSSAAIIDVSRQQRHQHNTLRKIDSPFTKSSAPSFPKRTFF